MDHMILDEILEKTNSSDYLELLSKFEQLQKQVEALRSRYAESVAKECKCENWVGHNEAVGKRKVQLDKQVEVLKEACEFYADKSNWDWGNELAYQVDDSYEGDNKILYGGKTARTALEKIKEIGGG